MHNFILLSNWKIQFESSIREHLIFKIFEVRNSYLKNFPAHKKIAADCFCQAAIFLLFCEVQVQSIPSVGARRTVEELLTFFVPPEPLPDP